MAEIAAVKSLDSFNFTAMPSRIKMDGSGTGALRIAIERRENVSRAYGDSGTIKTHIEDQPQRVITSVSRPLGLTVGFITAAALVHELGLRPGTRSACCEFQKQLAKYKLLII